MPRIGQTSKPVDDVKPKNEVSDRHMLANIQVSLSRIEKKLDDLLKIKKREEQGFADTGINEADIPF